MEQHSIKHYLQEHIIPIRRICVGVLIILIGLSALYWGHLRDGFFWDEFYSFEGAKKGGIGSMYWDSYPGFYDTFHTHAEFLSRVTIEKSDLLINKGADSLKRAFDGDWYYATFNLIYSFSAGHFSKWPIVFAQALVFMLCAWLVYRLSFMFSDSHICAVITMLLYGFSPGCIKSAVFLRTYMFSTLFILLFICVQVKLLTAHDWHRIVIYIFETLLLLYVAFRFHELNLLLIVCLTFSFWIVSIIKKIRMYFYTILSVMIAGGLGLIFLARGFVNTILYSDGYIAVHARESIMNPDLPAIARTFLSFGQRMFREILYTPYRISFIILSILAIIGLIAFIRKRPEKISINAWMCFACMLGALLYFGVLSVIFVNWHSWRYILIAYPILLLFPVFFLYKASQRLRYGTVYISIICIALAMGIFFCWIEKRMDILYEGTTELAEELDKDYAGYEAVATAPIDYIYEAAYMWPEGQSVYVAETPVELAEYLSGLDTPKVLLYTNGGRYDWVMYELLDKTKYYDARWIAVYNDNHDNLYIVELNRVED